MGNLSYDQRQYRKWYPIGISVSSDQNIEGNSKWSVDFKSSILGQHNYDFKTPPSILTALSKILELYPTIIPTIISN